MSYRNGFLAFVSVLMLSTAAQAVVNVYSDGSDGALVVDPNETITIDLRDAYNGVSWNTPSPRPGDGIYDPAKWAVVYKYSSVIIGEGATVYFINHPSGAPVVWLVSGPVSIGGTVNLNGQKGHDHDETATHAEPGPGGFRGGRGSRNSTSGSAGFGPGGAGLGAANATGGSYATLGTQGVQVNNYGAGPGGIPGTTYGNARILPLIGGSGGAGAHYPNSDVQGGGGAGGGAILIASSTTIMLTESGIITASGGSSGVGLVNNGTTHCGGGGSGGAIRLIADSIAGDGLLRAASGTGVGPTIWGAIAGGGGHGRIRVEANSISLTDSGAPAYTAGLPGAHATIWPDTLAPNIRVVSLAGHAVGLDPKRGLLFPQQEVFMNDPDSVPLVIEAFNVPTDATMTVRVTPKSGNYSTFSATQDPNDGLWRADIQIPTQISAIQVRAVLP